jgi:hypothetical protein
MPSTTRQTTSTPRSIHTQHRDRQRCAGHKAQLLQVLTDAHPHAPSLDDLLVITTRLSARVEELRSEGWQIETVKIEGRPSTYRLVSKVRGTPIVIAAAITIHVPVGGQAQVKTHERLSGDYTQDLLDYAAEQAKRAYLRALGRGTPPPKVEAHTDDLDLFTDGGW